MVRGAELEEERGSTDSTGRKSSPHSRSCPRDSPSSPLSPPPPLLPRALMSQAKVRLRVRTCSLSTVESDGGVVLLHLEEQPGEAVKEREGEVRENAIA